MFALSCVVGVGRRRRGRRGKRTCSYEGPHPLSPMRSLTRWTIKGGSYLGTVSLFGTGCAMMDEKDGEDKSDEENVYEKGLLYYFVPRYVDSRSLDINIPGHILAKYLIDYELPMHPSTVCCYYYYYDVFKRLRLEYGLPSTLCSSFLPEAKPFTIILDAVDECEREGICGGNNLLRTIGRSHSAASRNRTCHVNLFMVRQYI